jgi:hypothetical protein
MPGLNFTKGAFLFLGLLVRIIGSLFLIAFYCLFILPKAWRLPRQQLQRHSRRRQPQHLLQQKNEHRPRIQRQAAHKNQAMVRLLRLFVW